MDIPKFPTAYPSKRFPFNSLKPFDTFKKNPA